ncbi:conserved hypothetical protein [Rippkaea orientalis PCC 8801]|uniref:DUF2996 domain-containing protein n=1 Tax=Rippkaea orientalis (strain PCC 8801 / RF-1) TaxID=41431 RepID=B7JVD5_RIPO1|nr:DUF2996 domain-containing protein [Rippkaea orientalis]ACK68268.1 conserved hypothetical protein [Rippkaea orientalis PCC 8801]
MTEETTPQPPKKEKPPALEDKPFTEFIEQDFTPALKEGLTKQGISDVQLSFTKDKMSIPGADSTEQFWQVVGTFNQGKRQFNLYFLDESIGGQKAFSWAVNGRPPSTLESFMIDEKKVTLDLMVLYTLQRLNGQKWLTRN